MNPKKIKIILGKEGPYNILPGDTIQGIETKIQYYVKRVVYDKISDVYWLDTETAYPQDPTDTNYILYKESKIAPWYHEVCETCATPESCDLCQKLIGWTTKKFAYIGDTVKFFESTEVIEELSIDSVVNELVITTNRSAELLLDDPEIKIIKRGPWLCYRAKIRPNYRMHCSVCLRPKCSDCFFQKLQENQG
jgi:hypothetical protein